MVLFIGNILKRKDTEEMQTAKYCLAVVNRSMLLMNKVISHIEMSSKSKFNSMRYSSVFLKITSVKKIFMHHHFLLKFSLAAFPLFSMAQDKTRARDLGIPFEGSGPLVKGKGPVRTGVTAILPGGKKFTPVFANWHMLNGNGDMTGTHWITESGFLETPILITNTSSVGTVRDAAQEWMDEHKYYNADEDGFWYSYPLVAETWDGILNDINSFHVKKEDAWAALDSAASGPVMEGNAGGGTGMICHGFKGGIGTASRVVDKKYGGYTIGVLVQANYGSRSQLTIAGVPVGKELLDTLPLQIKSQASTKVKMGNDINNETGSIIVIVATDAPLLPHQLKRIAQRVSLGIGKMGGIGGNGSGDIFLAFSTANKNAFDRNKEETVTIYPNALPS